MSKKRPLPGYRFIFTAFGVLMILLASAMIYEMIIGKGELDTADATTTWIVNAMPFVWIIVGSIFIWYAYILATAELTTKHWKLGWFLIPLGILTGYGIIFVFMALIWNDGDVKAHFKRPGLGT